MGDDPMMPVDDPEWARRVAAIEKEFRQAERRRQVARRVPRAPRRRQFRAMHLWIGITVVIIAYAVIATVSGPDRVSGNDFPPPTGAQTAFDLTTAASAGAITAELPH